MSPNDADGMVNSVDPDQTAPWGAVWSGSALFAQAYLSENLGSLLYTTNRNIEQHNVFEPRHEKTCFCHMRTKPQISLRIHAFWSAPLLFAA